jgi:KipI family sensor histidine kinase inhibitor
VVTRLLPMGERAVLAEVDSLAAARALHARLAADRPAGVVDLVPAARTVLVVVDPALLPLARARAWMRDAAAAPVPRMPEPTREVVLDIRYDGPDLSETAALLETDAEGLARRHAATTWTVAFTGFAPGFGYLVSDEWPFDVPRLDAPRMRVPAGAVGLAAGFTGAYPRETPGGWRLIGTTDAPLFDPGAADPALLAPGTRVRFRPTGAGPGPAPVEARAARSEPTNRPRTPADVPRTDDADGGGRGTGSIRVAFPGFFATVQDLGRAGSAALGVARAGAMDRTALRAANRLVGNPESAAGIEVAVGGFRAVTDRDRWIAVTGGWGPLLRGGRLLDPYTPHLWAAGTELEIGWLERGARAYLAVRGGIDTPLVIGSRATDTLAALGPVALAPGTVLPVGAEPDLPVPVAPDAPWGAPEGGTLELDLGPGPRPDWFAPSAHAALYEATWTVTTAADRVGIRLDGPSLDRSRTDELPSEGMIPGALQVPPSGRPTILGPDAPVTGGYPVIAVVTDASLDLLGQARPGTVIRFRHARGDASSGPEQIE